jgi:hypothetical protein
MGKPSSGSSGSSGLTRQDAASEEQIEKDEAIKQTVLSAIPGLLLSAPLGLGPGIVLGVATEYLLPLIMNDPTFQKGMGEVDKFIFGKSLEKARNKQYARDPKAEAAFDEQRRREKAYYEAKNQEEKNRLAAFKKSNMYKTTQLHQAVYDQSNKGQSANIGPLTYIAPVINSIEDQKKARMKTYIDQQKGKLNAITQENMGKLEKQQAELATLKNSQKIYYATLQTEVAKQAAARNQVAKIEADQKAKEELALQQATSITPTRRRLPATIDLKGAIVGRGRRK